MAGGRRLVKQPCLPTVRRQLAACFWHAHLATCQLNPQNVAMNVFWIVLVPCFTAFLVPESVPIGHVVGYISGKPEVSTQPRYFVVFPDEQTSKFLKVDEASGEISTVSLLDYEKRSRFEILAVPVQGADGIQIIVDVDDENDNAPKFADESLFLEISEYAHIGSEFALPVAFDGDGPKYDVHKYHIVQGNVNNVFKISTRRLHDVLYADLVVNGQLDREYRDKYELLVEALDGGNPPKSGQLRVSIKILDANDNAPLFTQSRYSTTVAANISVGSTIVTVKATDADTEQKCSHNTNSPSNLFFSISSSSGVLTTTGHLLPASVHDVIVVASDGGSPSLQSTAVVSVVVQGATLTPPAIDLIWLTEASAAHLLENATLGSIVARVSLNEEHKDCVLELSGCHSLCLQQTDSAHVYLLLVCGNFDRETTEEFHLKFSLKRDNAVVLEHPLLLTIGDVNDNWPLWRSNPVHLSLNRTVGGGRILSASDADLGQNGWVRYSVLDTNLVSIDADTGRLFIPKELDCDVGQELRFRVRAEDGGVPPLSSDLQVTADLLDLESRPPTFEKALYELEVPEDTPIGTCLVKV
ncbi:unnamed protein product [Caenorhabditis auriculariae]|uniref:Cadherin domain-containing protein n=1 Tax=Caenorhabditis auriculariae TaxID=2777116 RepID=A0A8S1GY55_9PELO|nr:unnamed protein product [Caenorhabditis auriculariae]